MYPCAHGDGLIDPNAVINSPAPALFLALLIIAAFMAGLLHPAKTVDQLFAANKELRAMLDAMRVTFDRRTDVDEERLRVEKQQAELRQDRRHGAGRGSG